MFKYDFKRENSITHVENFVVTRDNVHFTNNNQRFTFAR